jgi:hypothetical protein
MPRRSPNRLTGPVPVRVEPLPDLRPPKGTPEARLLALLSPLSRILRTQPSESRELVETGAAIRAEPVPSRPPSSDVALATARELAEGIEDGRPLEPLFPRLSRLISNQERRAEIFDQLFLTHEFSRAVDLAAARAHIEHKLIVAAFRGDLTVEEEIAVFDRIIELERESRNRIKGGAIAVSDLMAMLQKADATLAVDEGVLATKFAQTTPQGREIVRKLAMRLGKAARSAERK